MFRTSSNRMESSVDASGISTTALPSALNGNYSWIDFCSLWSDGSELIASWVGPNREVRIAKRLYVRSWESSIDLSTVTGTVFGSQVTLDSHNVIAVAKCSSGYYHVAGDMHAVALKYMRSSVPGSLTSWSSGMVGTQESSVTYPQFIKAKSGILYFFYRDGTSGDGDWYLNKWNANTLTWSRVAMILEGQIENVSPYPQNIAVDSITGRWYLLWTIRTSFVGPEFNHDIYYAYSDDEGVTWRKTDGTTYSLPITPATGEIIVSLPGGTTTTISNGGQTCANSLTGKPHSVWLVADSSAITRYRHIYLDNSNVWHYDTLLPTVNASSRLPGIQIWPDGKKWMVFQTASGGRFSYLRYLDIDTNQETILRAVDMLHYMPASFYSVDRNVLYLLAPYERQDGAHEGDPSDLGNQLNVPVIAVRP